MNIHFTTFGCKVNTYETAAMAEDFRRLGYTRVEKPASADIAVINSCTVTAGGDKKVRQFLRRIKRENPQCITVLCGCFPQAYPDSAAAYEEADIVTGTGNRADVPKMVEAYLQNHTRTIAVVPNDGKEFEPLTAGHIEGHTRAFMKIEDGCDRYCAYCVIPYARGPVRSLSLPDVVRGAETLAKSGHRELVLSGINLSYYGRGTAYGLADAVEAVCTLPDIERVRLGSLEPDLLSDDTLARLAACDKLCPQFHLSLQSGCDATLRRMDRHYTTADYADLLTRMRLLFDRPTFTTDVIVGFPGETDDDFEQSLVFVQKMGFLKVHVFPYSLRPGTKAENLPGHLDKKVKEQRAAALTEAAEGVRAEIMRSFVGTQVRIIAEQPITGGLSGYTDRYLPARICGDGIVPGDTVQGTIRSITDGLAVVEPNVTTIRSYK